MSPEYFINTQHLKLLSGIGPNSLLDTALKKPFCLSPGQQEYWKYHAEEMAWPREIIGYNRYMKHSEDPIYWELYGYRYLAFASHVIVKEEDPDNDRLTTATKILRNAAWREGNHLETVVSCAAQVLEMENRLLSIYEDAIGAVQNTTFYIGPHNPKALEVALSHYSKTQSGRTRYDSLLIIRNISRHTPNLVRISAVKLLLANASTDPEDTIAQTAIRIHTDLFSQQL